MKVFYFGCNQGAGHYMHGAGMSSSKEAHDFLVNNPWKFEVDTGLCPPGPQEEGRAALHFKEGWTALAFWDRSVDGRQNSNSVFLTEGLHSFDDMIAIAKEKFPTVMNRFKFQIVRVTHL